MKKPKKKQQQQIETVVRQEWIFRLVLELFYLKKSGSIRKIHVRIWVL